MLRFHSQTAGSTLTAQEPHNNVPRVTMQALAAVLGGTQSLHTNSYDEALALPAEASARLALRTQQVIAEETHVTDAVDPLAGSHHVEALTDEVERLAVEYLERIDAMGGALAGIEANFQQREIEEAAYRAQRDIERGDAHVVGVNVHESDVHAAEPEIFRVDPKSEQDQLRTLAERKAARDPAVVAERLRVLKDAAAGTGPLMEPIVDALRVDVSLGEICHALRDVWGVYHPQQF
jgi:methylmalonyl-CoA mutase N-terminal domain/subunit